ncbi:Mevalonate kinase [hydrothermal vent metagenome]|uniref:Mevalonate kinase n=1 Tax=hydrothermal vent metagenome TaxID=652676 RepID=A0A3B0U5B6_9ZZZZ
MKTKSFYSNGKLLLSGEYAILDGASGLAIPTKYGQHLKVSKSRSSILSWKSLDEKGAIWFEGNYDKGSLQEISSSDKDVSKRLLKILLGAKRLNLSFLKDQKGCEVETKLTFLRNWGLGSSSTLINNIANWANVNAYHLLESTFGGSGYDIACAQCDSPILFCLENKQPVVKEVDFNPPFKNELYFVYLNKKQNSQEGIAQYRNRDIDKSRLTTQLSVITSKMLACERLDVFEELINEHETLLSTALEIQKIKDTLFKDFNGAIKSLGAWGGDFILATGEDTSEYFKRKGHHTIIPYQAMILH